MLGCNYSRQIPPFIIYIILKNSYFVYGFGFTRSVKMLKELVTSRKLPPLKPRDEMIEILLKHGKNASKFFL